MIGIVAVSHSAALGEAALQLALQMVPGGRVAVRVAAGAGTDADGQPVLGTDAVAVSAAIDELAEECDGIVVIMDLGSALLSAEFALELRMSDEPVRLTSAPFVEGLLAAVVAASAGGDLDVVAAEATAAMGAKASQLGDSEAGAVDDASRAAGRETPDAEPVTARTVVVRNPLGVHARPAALIAEAAAGEDVRLRRLPDGAEVAASSLMGLLALGARAGTEVELAARGDNAEAVLDRLAALFDDGFGEGIGAGPGSDGADGEVPSDGGASAEVSSADVPVVPGATVIGRGVSGGHAAAPVVHVQAAIAEPDADTVVDKPSREAETTLIAEASQRVGADLRARAEAASGEARSILEAGALMTADPELLHGAAQRVREHGRTAARAVWETASEQAAALIAIGGAPPSVRPTCVMCVTGSWPASSGWNNRASPNRTIPLCWLPLTSPRPTPPRWKGVHAWLW